MTGEKKKNHSSSIMFQNQLLISLKTHKYIISCLWEDVNTGFPVSGKY